MYRLLALIVPMGEEVTWKFLDIGEVQYHRHAGGAYL
jgi:hypothetical protein